MSCSSTWASQNWTVGIPARESFDRAADLHWNAKISRPFCAVVLFINGVQQDKNFVTIIIIIIGKMRYTVAGQFLKIDPSLLWSEFHKSVYVR